MQQDMTVEPKKSRLTEQIDENLKRVYEELLKEQVPDRFTQLLAQLKEKERGK
jgi:CRISPR/Cas system endoribonuclease Cas6 (RAMP superfamily)